MTGRRGDNTYHPRCLDCGCTAPFDAWQSRTPSPAEVERLVDDLIHYSAVITTYILSMTDESKTLEDATESFKQAKSRLLAALSNTTPYLSQDVIVGGCSGIILKQK